MKNNNACGILQFAMDYIETMHEMQDPPRTFNIGENVSTVFCGLVKF